MNKSWVMNAQLGLLCECAVCQLLIMSDHRLSLIDYVMCISLIALFAYTGARLDTQNMW